MVGWGFLVRNRIALERYGPQLPAGLRELFVPSGTNETQLSIYGALAVGYSHILGDSLKSAMGATGPVRPRRADSISGNLPRTSF